MSFKRHGNGYNDHATSTYKGRLGKGRIFIVKRRDFKTSTKNPRDTDVIIGYVDPENPDMIIDVEGED